MTRYWVLVADAARARILASDDQFASFTVVCELRHEESQMPITELVSSPRGRTRAGPDGVGSAYDRHSDPHRVEATKFARQLAVELERGLHERRYDAAVLCAPAQFLGALRAELASTVANVVAGSVSHDWTGFPVRDLPDRLRKALPELGLQPNAS